jgi:pyroglutamyl-peptidase
MKVLITGFAPFNNEKINPSYEAVKLISDMIDDIIVEKLEVPVSFNNAFKTVLNKIKDTDYDAVILVGQAGGRSMITLEKVAINYRYATIPDNDGASFNHESIIEDGMDAYFTTLPIVKMVDKLKENDIKASISFTAGTYVCNDLMYRVINYFKENNKNTKAGFIHVPYIKEQVENKENMPYMELNDIVKGLSICIKESVGD